MKLLFETTNRTEVDETRFLLESRGIPIFIGNENAGNMLGPVFTARQFGLWVILEEHHEDAQALLNNPEHIVNKPVDVESFYTELEKHKPQTLNKMLRWSCGITIAVIALIYLFIVYS